MTRNAIGESPSPLPASSGQGFRLIVQPDVSVTRRRSNVGVPDQRSCFRQGRSISHKFRYMSVTTCFILPFGFLIPAI